ncbi:OLC1v1016100C1 [Oldenlandia corymbosa var. corymbosa]|uniref:OLC1v1016100C1 n=1 Tax=Oldenlandia corymbosa var. corymbosa TaxID=529605 RepID=A0AAV1E6I7_OLDCO|nr:OLC1v1016100C1 [Oldenlandia corymbosa var. corymbosa]
MRFPVGMKFNPTEEELLSHYLKNKIMGHPLSDCESQFLIDINMYGEKATPWELFCSNSDQFIPWLQSVDISNKDKHSEEILYVSTKLKSVGKTNKSENKQKCRVAGCGTWHANNTKQPITVIDDNNGESILIGYRRNFTFRSPTQETIGQWNMTEYSINPIAFGLRKFNCEDYVLCKIKRDHTKSSFDGKLVSKKRKFFDTATNSRKKVMKSSPSSSSSQISSYSEDEKQSMNNNNLLQVNSSNGFLPDSSTTYDQEALQETISGIEDSETVVENNSINQEDFSNSDLWFDFDELLQPGNQDMDSLLKTLDNWPAAAAC